MITVADYLLTRLRQLGVGHIFGVPGDFVLGFLNHVLDSEVEYVGTCNELNAAYAADGYARIRGVGALVTTYGVGELSAINGVAGSFAERIPVVVITGAPATAHFQRRALLHHTLGDYGIPMRMFESITAASTLLSCGETAPDEIDRVLCACLTQRQPVYICIPADVVAMPCRSPAGEVQAAVDASDPTALAEALDEAMTMIRGARKPIIIADVELVRFGLQAELGQLLKSSGFPFVTRMLGKAMLSEHGGQFIGLYQGDRSRPYVRERVESADCVLQLGALLTDFNTGGFTATLDESRTISANIRSVQVKHHVYERVALSELMLGLARRLQPREPGTLGIRPAVDAGVHRPAEPFTVAPLAALTVDRFFDRISHFLEPDTIVVAETGVSIAPSEPLGRRALAAAFQEFAVHETLALECFKAMAKADLEPVVRRAVDRIVRDEARHRRLGWELVRALLALTGERAWLESLAPAAIRGVLACYPADTAAPSAGEARWALLSGAAYASAVASAPRGPISTQLARNGLDAVEARVNG